VGKPRQRFQSACGDATSDAFLAGAIQSAARSGRWDERNSAVAFVPRSRLPSSDWLVTAGAFIGTNPEASDLHILALGPLARVIGSKRLLCIELFVEVVRTPGRTNAASARDFQNRSSWQFPRRRSGQPPSSAAQIRRVAFQLPSRVTVPFPP